MPEEPQITKHVVNVGVNALAREVGLSGAAVSKKLQAGKTPDQIRQEAEQRRGTAPAKKGAPSKKKPSTAPGRPPQSSSEYELIRQGRERTSALDDAKLRRARALAERSEIENALRRGQLIPAAYIRTWGTRFLVDARDTLLTAESELADGLAAETDPLKTAAILRTWIERVMGKFHQLERLWGAGEEEQVA